MIPQGASKVTLQFDEEYPHVWRKKVQVYVKGKYGKISVPAKYVGQELVILVPKSVEDYVVKPKRRR